MRDLRMEGRVLPPQILALLSKDTNMLSDKACAADHQTIDKVSRFSEKGSVPC